MSEEGQSFPGTQIILAMHDPWVGTIRVVLLLPTTSGPHPVVIGQALLGGFSMMAVRIYEVLLLHKLLRCRPDIDTERLGLIGHSGGSAVGNLAIRVAPEIFDAYVSDNLNSYFNWVDSALQDETDPAIYPWSQIINDFSTSSVPVLEVPYAFENEYQDIADFFDLHLGNSADAGTPGRDWSNLVCLGEELITIHA